MLCPVKLMRQPSRHAREARSTMPRQRLHRVRRLLTARFPLLWRCARRLKWTLAAPIHRSIVRWSAAARKLHADPYQVYWISPRTMNNTLYGPDDVPNPANVSGMVKGGGWDRKTLPVQDLKIVRAAKDRFIRGMAWAQTEYYRDALERISRGEGFYGCRNKEDVDRHCSRIDRLYEDIRDNGYKSQAEVRGAEWGHRAHVGHEITVHIDRDGRFLFCDGRRRLAVALALGVERIPVKVCIRHAQWHAFCCEILNHAERNGGRVYQPLTHPDLQDVPSAHGEEWFEIIRDSLPESKGELLDIGAHWGYFCHRFEEVGFTCYAVERDPGSVYFMRKLARAEDRQFRIIERSVCDYHEKSHFDVVLALNVFHHFLKTRESHGQLVRLLRRLDANEMFFEPHLPSEFQMKGLYVNYEPDEFTRVILEHSNLDQSTCIGNASDGRRLYRLWDSARIGKHARDSRVTTQRS